MYVINKATSLINRVNKLNKKCSHKYKKYFLNYIYILFYLKKRHRSKNIISSTDVATLSRCPKMPSAVVNNLQVPEHPYDHETCNITLAILMSTAGEVTVQNIIFDLVITCKFCLSIWPSHLLQWNGYLLDGESQIIKYWLWSAMPNSASDRIGPRTRLFRLLHTRSSWPLPIEREAEGLLCSCWSTPPNSVSRSSLYLHYKQNYRTGYTKFCDFCYTLCCWLPTQKRDQRRRWSSITPQFMQQSLPFIVWVCQSVILSNVLMFL